MGLINPSGEELPPPGIGVGVDADEKARLTIPTRGSLDTQYGPVRNLMMVIPLPTNTMHGALHLPQRSQLPMNEGHIVEMGPLCVGQYTIGDCVLWDPNSEVRVNIDDKSKFVLIRESDVMMRIPREKLQMDLELWGKKQVSES